MTTATDRCEATMGLYLGGIIPADVSIANSWGCTEPATVTLRGGCVHEHVKQKRFCAEHGDLDPAEAVWRCRECAEMGHDCPLAVERVQ